MKPTPARAFCAVSPVRSCRHHAPRSHPPGAVAARPTHFYPRTGPCPPLPRCRRHRCRPTPVRSGRCSPESPFSFSSRWGRHSARMQAADVCISLCAPREHAQFPHRLARQGSWRRSRAGEINWRGAPFHPSPSHLISPQALNLQIASLHPRVVKFPQTCRSEGGGGQLQPVPKLRSPWCQMVGDRIAPPPRLVRFHHRTHTPPSPSSTLCQVCVHDLGPPRYDTIALARATRLRLVQLIFGGRIRCALPDCCEIVTCVLRWRVDTTTLRLALCTNRYVRLVSKTSNSVKSGALGRDWVGG